MIASRAMHERGASQAVATARLVAQVSDALTEVLTALPPDEGVSSEVLGRIYERLLATILRLVVALFAEARGPLADHSAPRVRPSPAKLYEELRGTGGELAARFDAWPRACAVLEGGPFDRDVRSSLEMRSLRVSDAVVLRVLEHLMMSDGERVAYRALDVETVGSLYENLVGFTIERRADGRGYGLAPTDARRRSGSHFTPRSLTEPIVRATLGPVLDALGARPKPESVLGVKVCDPAMGAGAFLVEACRQLGDALAQSWEWHGRPDSVARADDRVAAARAQVARCCLYGVDRNRLAVDLARLSLWLVARAKEPPEGFVDHALKVGDSLVGVGPGELAAIEGTRHAADREVSKLLRGEEGDRALHAFHWEVEFPEVFRAEGGARRGFDAVIGNPPWVSYAGRAAQPLDSSRRRYFLARYASFAGYRNLQGLFVERAAQLARPHGRVGLVLPSSMAELDGYGPTRAAHDRLACCDPELPDLGEDSFRGVFQPSMVLRSTVRATPLERGSPAPWPIERPDVDPEALAILARLERPALPPELFGERGLQTFGDDTDHCKRAPDDAHTVPLRVGSDIQAFRRGAPSLYADAAWFGRRLRAADEWRKVDVLIRQTARVPIACRSDGEGFRNSVLACFASERFPVGFLVAYLNSSVVRWRHYYRNRDARLGMPQVKIGHLRAIPAPPSQLVDALTKVGDALNARNDGITREESGAVNALVADAFALSGAQRERIERDAARW
jgi:hypothetical protein